MSSLPAEEIPVRNSGSGVLSNPNEIRADLRMINRAIRNEFKMSRQRRRQLVASLMDVATMHPDPEIRVQASDTLTKMDALNQKREAKVIDALIDRRPHPGSTTFIDKQIVMEESSPAESIAPAVQELTTELRSLLTQCLPQNPQPAPPNGNGHSDNH